MNGCKDCKYFEETNWSDKDGICHRFPPQIVHTHTHGGQHYFRHLEPEVYEDDWCGEYVNKWDNK